jgi:hypothetical protein
MGRARSRLIDERSVTVTPPTHADADDRSGSRCSVAEEKTFPIPHAYALIRVFTTQPWEWPEATTVADIKIIIRNQVHRATRSG